MCVMLARRALYDLGLALMRQQERSSDGSMKNSILLTYLTIVTEG